jgi:NADPH-dependent FMN reductase
MEEAIRVALIYGSTRKGRFCDTVARWAASQIVADSRFLLEIVDPGVDDGTDSLTKPGSEAIGSPQAVIERADAVVVVTPEYNHGYPAPLKALIDSTGLQWHAKPVAFVSYGGVSGGCVPLSNYVRSSQNCTPSRFETQSALRERGSSSMPTGCRCRLSEGRDRWERCSSFFTGGPLHCAMLEARARI